LLGRFGRSDKNSAEICLWEEDKADLRGELFQHLETLLAEDLKFTGKGNGGKKAVTRH
jgi:hypothetical protein